jgi:predicted metal-dependent phosphoesterase TrpH
MYADLHIHSCFSDGILSPKEILDEVISTSLESIAITDHDNIKGSIEAQKINRRNGYDLEIIPGIEFSCLENRQDFHIIGLFIDYDSPYLNETIDVMQKKRIDSIKKIVKFLNQKNINISFKDILSLAKGSVGRPHVALDLINKRYANNVNEAFDKYLSMNVSKAIITIKKSGGIPIWAHPNIKDINFEKNLKEFIVMGLAGIEVTSPRYGLNRQEIIINVCSKYNLLLSGGSDFHGFHKGIDISSDYGIKHKEFIDIKKYLNIKK